MINWPILKKITTTLRVCACITHNCGSRAKIKNLLTLVCLPHQLLSEIVCHDPVAPTTTEEIDYRKKDWMQAQSYRVGTGHEYYPPNSYRAPTKQAQINSSKLVHPFKSHS